MKRVLSIASLVFCIALAGSLSAQAPTAGMKIASEADYATHMKEIGQLNGVLNKSVKGGDAAEAGKAAARMEVLFKNVHALLERQEGDGRNDRRHGRRQFAAGCAESARRKRHGRCRNGAGGDRRQLHVVPYRAPRETAGRRLQDEVSRQSVNRSAQPGAGLIEIRPFYF